MHFKRISIRMDLKRYSDKFSDRVKRDKAAGFKKHNRVLVFRYEEKPRTSTSERFVKTLAYLEKVLEKFPNVKIVDLRSGSKTTIMLFLPESVSENSLFSELSFMFESIDVKDNIGRVEIMLRDLKRDDIVTTHTRIIFQEYSERLYNLIESYEINEGEVRPAEEPYKKCLRNVVNYLIQYYLDHSEKDKEFIALIEGVEELIKLKQDISSLLAFVCLKMKMTRNESRRFLLTVGEIGCYPQSMFKLIEIAGEFGRVDDHLLIPDKKDSRKANRLKKYLIWKSYDLARKHLKGVFSEYTEEDIRRIAYRSLIISMMERYVSVREISDEETKLNTANRMFYVDSLIARDLDMEEFQYKLRAKVFDLTHPREVSIIEEELLKRYKGKTRKELEQILMQIKELFQEEYILQLISDLESEIEMFLSSKEKSMIKEKYIKAVKEIIKVFYTNGTKADSEEYRRSLEELRARLTAIGGLQPNELTELLEIIEYFMRHKKVPEIQMRIKTPHSIYEKARRLKYDKLKKEYEADVRRLKSKTTEIPSFNVDLDEIGLGEDDIRHAMSYEPKEGETELIHQFKGIRDEKMFDIAGFRFIVDTPEERERPFFWLSEFGVILEKDTINNSRGYRAIHVKLFENILLDEAVDLQIRDIEAHREAEEGDAQHRFYKGGEKHSAIGSFNIYNVLIDRIYNLKYVPVEIYHCTRSDKVESISRDFVILDKSGNRLDVLIQGGYYRFCINESEVRAENEEVTRIKVKPVVVRDYYENLLKKINTLRTRLIIKIAMAVAQDAVKHFQEVEVLRKQYEHFMGILIDLVSHYQLDDINMLFSGMAVDYYIKDLVDKQLKIFPEIQSKIVRRVSGRDKREGADNRSTRLIITVTNRTGVLNYWLGVLRQKGFYKAEELDCESIGEDKFRITIQFKGTLRDDVIASIRADIGIATEYYKATKERLSHTRPLAIEVTMPNSMANVIALTKVFRDRDISIKSLSAGDEGKRGVPVKMHLVVAVTDKQYAHLKKLRNDISALSFINSLEITEGLEDHR